MLRSELLKRLQVELSLHTLDTFTDREVGMTIPGCPHCRKRINTIADYNHHLALDVLPALLQRLASDGGAVSDDYYLDTEYWADPERNIRRKSGEQDAILCATRACSKSEWMMLLAGLGMSDLEQEPEKA